jgi:hypothetical protein
MSNTKCQRRRREDAGGDACDSATRLTPAAPRVAISLLAGYVPKLQQQSAASTHGNKIARSPGGGVIIPGQDFEREVDADGGLWARGWRGGGGIDEEHMEGRWWRYYGGSSAGSGGCKGHVMDAAVAMMRVAVMMTIMMFHLVRG